MGVGAFIWVDLVAALVLGLWVIVRHPELGPRSLRWAVIVFAFGQVVARLAVPLMAPLVQLRDGVQLVLLIVILPALFVMALSSLWLVRAMLDAIGGPRGGHPVRERHRHAARYRAPSHSARSR